MAASVHRLIDAIAPVESAFSDSERAAILAETKAILAERPAPRVAPLPEPEDPVTRWKREADEKTAREAAALERDRVRERRQQRQHQQSWADYVARTIESALVIEREHTEAVLIGLLADVLRQNDELVKRVAALESNLPRKGKNQRDSLILKGRDEGREA